MPQGKRLKLNDLTCFIGATIPYWELLIQDKAFGPFLGQ
jgi:hypothetical protein